MNHDHEHSAAIVSARRAAQNALNHLGLEYTDISSAQVDLSSRSENIVERQILNLDDSDTVSDEDSKLSSPSELSDRSDKQDSTSAAVSQAEDLSREVLQTIGDAQHLAGIHAHPRSKSRVLLALRPGQKVLQSSAQECVLHLNTILSNVQQLHHVLTVDNVSLSLVLAIYKALKSILSALDNLVIPLRNASSTDPELLENFSVFNKVALEWVNYPTSSLPSASHKTPEIDVVDKIITFLKGVVLNSNASFLSSPAARDAETKYRGDMCPLEATMTRAIRVQPLKYPIDNFTTWARRESYSSSIHKKVGSVLSVHLLRERKAPLHHEFFVMRFGDGHVADSWVRVERAARLKDHWYSIQKDSFGPLFGGAELRENISFATTKEALCTGADELATITLELDEPITAVSKHMLLPDAAMLLGDTSDTYPEYLLLSANCRWFARRNTLSFTQRALSLGVPSKVHWEGNPSTFEDLRTRLQDDPFGGKHVEGKKANMMKAANLISLSRSFIVSDQEAEAYETSSEALRILEDMTPDSPRRQFLISVASRMLGVSLYHQDRFEEALEHQQRACEYSRLSRNTSDAHYLLSHESLAEALRGLKRFDEALSIQHEVSENWRSHLKAQDNPFVTEILGTSLHNEASDLRSLGRDIEALSVIEESVQIRRKLYAYRPDLHGRSLGQSLSIEAALLLKLGRGMDALIPSREALAVTRELFELHPDATRHSMAVRLIQHEQISVDAGLVEEGCNAGKEAVEQWQRLRYLKSKFAPDLAYAARLWASNLYSAKGIVAAALPLQEALSLERSLFIENPEKHAARYAGVASAFAALLIIDDHPEALPFLRESLHLTRSGLASTPDQTRLKLAEELHHYAMVTAHCSVKDAQEEARETGLEAVLLWRELFAEDPERHRASLSQSLLTLEHILGHNRQFAEQFEIAKEALFHNRHLHKDDPDQYFEALASAAKTYSNVLDELTSGHGDLATSVSNEYVALAHEMAELRPSESQHVLAKSLSTAAIHATESGVPDALPLITEAISRWRSVGVDTSSRAGLAAVLTSYGIFLRDSKNIPESQVVLQEAVDIYRDLYTLDSSSETLLRLAHCLFIYAGVMDDMEWTQEALALSRESIARTRDMLSVIDPVAVQHDLAERLFNHATFASKIQLWQEAFLVGRESVDFYRQMYNVSPDDHRANLAQGLNNLGIYLREIHRPVEALVATKEALDLFQEMEDNIPGSGKDHVTRLTFGVAKMVDELDNRLDRLKESVALARVMHRFKAFSNETRVHLAETLYRLAIHLAEIASLKEACIVGAESIQHWRHIVSVEHGAHAVDLAQALFNFGVDLHSSNLPDESQKAVGEALELYRHLYAADPDHNRANFAHYLAAYGGICDSLDQQQGAYDYTQESVKTTRHIVASHPNDHQCRIELAGRLSQCSKYAGKLDLHDEACALAGESVDIWRSLSAAPSNEQLEGLATALGNLAHSLYFAGKSVEAWKALEEAMINERTLFNARPNSRRASFIKSLLAYAGLSEALGHLDNTLIASRELAVLTRQAYDSDPNSSRHELAEVLSKHARLAGKLKLWDEACEFDKESLAHWRRLYADEPDSIRAELVDVLGDCALHSLQGERPGDVLGPLGEVASHLRYLRSADPHQWGERLAGSLESIAQIVDVLTKEYPNLPGLSSFDADALRREAEVVRQDIHTGHDHNEV